MEQPKPGIFLSHAHEDRSFVRRLARELRAEGIRVWIDESEMGVGDSLLEKITGAISANDYLGVVISRHSAHSDWVTREVEIALREEIPGQKVKVLPMLLRGGELPEALRGKTYADFRSELNYAPSVQDVLRRLGVEGPVAEGANRLTELAASSALLKSALHELRGKGLSNAVADALVSTRIDDFDLSEFLSLAAREVEGDQLFGLALTTIPCIDRRGVGHEALDYCLEPGRMEDYQVGAIGMHMQWVTTTAAVQWCHARLTSVIRSDPYYHSFLERHADTVLERCADEMTSYLLQPNRGPSAYNLDSFEIVVSRVEDPGPFESRWVEWILNGYFEGAHQDETESADLLYKTLNDHWGESRFARITKTINNRVYLLMKSPSHDQVNLGIQHLTAMVEARYRGAEHHLTKTLPRVYDLPLGKEELFALLHEALQAVVDSYAHPGDQEHEQLIQSYLLKVRKAARA